VARSGVQLLAVAVGNVNGRYAGEPKLRWDVLQDIAARITGLLRAVALARARSPERSLPPDLTGYLLVLL
jgi:Fructose-bisphosphate aldolase class-II